MNNYISNKYIFSPRQGKGNGGLFIVIPNQSNTADNLLNQLRSLRTLWHRVCPG